MINKKFLILFFVLATGLFIFFLFSYYLIKLDKDTKRQNFNLNLEINNFQLVTHDGEKFDKNLLGNTSSIFFFGFANCPDICPDTLIKISDIINKLKNTSYKYSFYFVTVDPERDTQENMKEYLDNFSNKIIGVTGSVENMKNFLKYMYVYNEKVILDNDFYTFDHSSQLFLFKKNGTFFGTISPGENIDTALTKIGMLN